MRRPLTSSMVFRKQLDFLQRLSPLNVFWQSGHWFQWLRTIGQIMQWFWWIVVIYPSKMMFLVQKYNSIIEAFLVLTSPSSCYWVGCWVIMQALWTTFSPWQPCLPPCLSVFPSPKIDIGNKSVCHPLMASAGQLYGKFLIQKMPSEMEVASPPQFLSYQTKGFLNYQTIPTYESTLRC